MGHFGTIWVFFGKRGSFSAVTESRQINVCTTEIRKRLPCSVKHTSVTRNSLLYRVVNTRLHGEHPEYDSFRAKEPTIVFPESQTCENNDSNKKYVQYVRWVIELKVKIDSPFTIHW